MGHRDRGSWARQRGEQLERAKNEHKNCPREVPLGEKRERIISQPACWIGDDLRPCVPAAVRVPQIAMGPSSRWDRSPDYEITSQPT